MADAKIKLYHCVSARSFRGLWALEELGLPYELVMLPFPPRQHARHFLALNPLGTIPLLVHGDTRMTESAAICQYLCSLKRPTSMQVEPDEADYGRYLNMLHFGEATLTFPQTLVLRYSRFEPEDRRHPVVAEDYAKWFLARLRTLEVRLAEDVGRRMTQMIDEADDPGVVAATVLRAAVATQPKLRYASGARASRLHFLRTFAPVGMVDAAIRKNLNLARI
jgi:glutathione S-transferase